MFILESLAVMKVQLNKVQNYLALYVSVKNK